MEPHRSVWRASPGSPLPAPKTPYGVFLELPVVDRFIDHIRHLLLLSETNGKGASTHSTQWTGTKASGLAIPDGQVRQANHACCVKPSLNGNANSTASNYLNLRRIREQRLLSAAVAARILKLTHIKNRNGKKKDLLHAREPEQKKEIGSTCTPERNQDQQLHLTELKQQIQEILGSVDQVKAAYRGTSHERPTRSSYFTPGTKQWSFFPQYPLLYFWTYSLALR
ncbi:hypothetical protein Tco_0540705 [Tanacetum coccineum]